jgi:hypothetical protein
MRHLLRFAFCLLLGVTMVVGQEPSAKKETPAKLGANETNILELSMADGSKVRLSLPEMTLRIQTKYGTLDVQGSEIRRIDLGFRYPEGMEEKVKEMVAALGSGSFRTRENAQQDLLRLGVLSVPALKSSLKSSDAEVSQRASEVLKKLEEKLTSEQMSVREYDMVITSDFPIKGKILTTHISGKTAYFGEAKVELAQVRKIRSTMFTAEMDINLDGTKYGTPNQEVWLEMEVEIAGGQALDIKASGQVSMYPGANYTAGPSGNARLGNSGQFPVGALLGRIGTDGKVFVVGERYSEPAKGSGKLYLRINPGIWGYPTTGTYAINVSAGVNRSLAPSSEKPKPEIPHPKDEKKDVPKAPELPRLGEK